MTPKYKWRVDPPPVGRYRSFENRQWPSATYLDGQLCASIISDEPYTPNKVSTGHHKPLLLRIYDYRLGPQRRRSFTTKATLPSVEACKAKLAELMERFPEWAPTEDRTL